MPRSAGHLLVVEVGDGVERYAFRHALVQEVVYDELLPGERRTLHRTFADALDARSPTEGAAEAGRWAELAHHWAAAREDDRAFDASLRAAHAAMGSYAFGAALVEYERALGLWDDVDGPERVAASDRIELLRKAGIAAYLAADYRRAVALRREAVAAGRPGDRPAPRRDPARGARVVVCGSSATAAARSRRTVRRSRSRLPTGLPQSGRGPCPGSARS